MSCTLRNLGGQLAENVTATLQVAAGVKVLDGARKKIDQLSLYLPKTIEWQVRADKPGKIDVTCEGGRGGRRNCFGPRTRSDLTHGPRRAESLLRPRTASP